MVNNKNFEIKSDSLIKINETIEQWAMDAAENEAEPSGVSIIFNFSNLGRSLSVKQDGSEKVCIIEEFE